MLRYDGLYMSEVQQGSPFRECLRFYPDGAVLDSREIASTPAQVLHWLNQSTYDQGWGILKGRFATQGDNIKFSTALKFTSGAQKRRDYAGKVLDDSVQLRLHDLTAGRTDSRQYGFVPVSDQPDAILLPRTPEMFIPSRDWVLEAPVSVDPNLG